MMQDGPISDVARAGLVVAGKFRLDTLIGQGGMGSVWSATHLGLGHQIAIKLVSRECVRSPDALRRFDAEAKAAARLQSRHVVQVYDSGTLDDATPYIAMELLSGQSLQSRIETAGPISLAESVEILAQCCKGLGRAHALGIVHRDIKPDNIFLAQSPDDDGYVVKVLDFGVAKLTLATDGDQSSTKTGTVLGTPLYMSPEQARGLRGIDHRTDIYSLGLVAYSMLTGRLAFSGESFGDILLKICTEPLPRISASVSVPSAVEAWFERVCARDPTARCSSTQEFIETLRIAVGDAVPRPKAPSGEHHPSASGSGGAFASSFVDSSVGPSQGSAQSVSAANVAITASGLPRSRAGAAVVIATAITLLGAGGLAFAFFASRHRAAPVTSPAVAPAESSASAPPPPAATLAAPPSPAQALRLSDSASPVVAAQVPHPGAMAGAVTKPSPHGGAPHPAPGPTVTPSKTTTSPSPTKIDLGY